MDFYDGDMVEGHYGNRLQRKNGQWETEHGNVSSDDTVEWLLNLDVPTPSVVWYSNKLSKSEKAQPTPFIYRWRLIRGHTGSEVDRL